MPTHHAGAVSSNPTSVIIRASLMRKATGNHYIYRIPFPGKNSEPCLWFLLRSKSSMQRSIIDYYIMMIIITTNTLVLMMAVKLVICSCLLLYTLENDRFCRIRLGTLLCRSFFKSCIVTLLVVSYKNQLTQKGKNESQRKTN